MPAAAAAAPSSNIQKLHQSSSKRSPSPPNSKTFPLPKDNKPILGGGGAAGAAVGKSSRAGDKPGAAAAAESKLPVSKTEEKPAPAPTDALSRAKMILEKKRKAAAGLGLSRIGSAASTGAGGLRKAKITKVSGTPASNARLDPVKVCKKIL